MKLLNRDIIIYPANKMGLDKPIIFSRKEDFDKEKYISEDEQAVAYWVYKNNKHAGESTNTLPGAKSLYLAIRNNDCVFAVIAIVMDNEMELDTFDKNIIIALLSEIALALEKDEINERKNSIEIKAKQEELRSNLLRTISHDLRTPLTSIMGNAGVLLKNSDFIDSKKKEELYSYIYDDSMWLINLVENLLSITRIDNGTMNIDMKSELIDEVIEEALKHINRRSNLYNINVNLEDDLLMAKMDYGLIIQVIVNIVDNALKYTEEGTDINISAKKKGKMILIQIADSGKGISDEAKDKLFDMFYTADNKSGDGRRGLGLGLSLCKSIIIAHGGEICVSDNKPHGTIFSFTLQGEEVNDCE